MIFPTTSVGFDSLGNSLAPFRDGKQPRLSETDLGNVLEDEIEDSFTLCRLTKER